MTDVKISRKWDGKEPSQLTAINSTEGADRKFPFSEIFDPRQRIVHISLSSVPIDLKPG
jgi:hypothetical protein